MHSGHAIKERGNAVYSAPRASDQKPMIAAMALRTIFDLPEKIQDKIMPEPFSGCWIWCGYCTGKAASKWKYGQVIYRTSDKVYIKDLAHRYVYTALRGTIPTGLYLDHLCRLTQCVNPDHLEPVTPRENIKRGSQGSKQFCHRGHEFTEENRYVVRRPPNGYPARICRAYKWERQRTSRAVENPLIEKECPECLARFTIGSMSQRHRDALFCGEPCANKSYKRRTREVA
jgi:hypothetical protein